MKKMKKLRRKIKSFLVLLCKKIVPPAYAVIKKSEMATIDNVAQRGIRRYLYFRHDIFKQHVLNYIQSMCCGGNQYKYSSSSAKPSIYGSVYACLTLSMFGEIEKLSAKRKKEWVEYFDSFQNKETGLFYDTNIYNELYDSADWWGARHLCPHIINAYIALGHKPKYAFAYLKPYYDLEFLKKWLDATDWNSAIMDNNDIDNQIMNIGVMLQYQRDYFNDKAAAEAIRFIKSYLSEKVNPETGLWGKYDVSNRYELCRMIQFSYHLLRLYMYDEEDLKYPEKIVDMILKSQNPYGGFGANIPSSACEDIDAIDPLVYITKNNTYRSDDVRTALRQALVYVLANQNDDGGFVFRIGEPLLYGHINMFSNTNESAMFPTWFRTLSIAYIAKVLPLGDFVLVKSPGY